MNDAQSRLRLVFAPHTSASRRKVEERLQSAAHHTREALISSHGVAARKVEQTPPIGNRERI
jgi:hypothetical protein